MSFIRRRGKKGTWHYYTRSSVLIEGEAKNIQTSFSLHTSDKVLAEHRQTEEDSKLLHGQSSIVNDKITWTTFEKEILKEYNKSPLFEKDSTYQKYQYAFRHFNNLINPVFVSKITSRDIGRWKQLRAEMTVGLIAPKAVSQTTVSIEYRCLNHAFKIAKNYGWIASNPVDGVSSPKPPKRLKRILDDTEKSKLLTEARKDEDVQLHLMALVFLYTGVRVTELINLRWENINLDKNVLDLKAYKVFRLKDREERSIPLFPVLTDELRKAWTPREYVFINTLGGMCDRFTVARKFTRLFARAGIINAKGVHLLRHTFCTWALDFMPLDLVKAIMGHSDPQTTLGYSQATEKRKQDAINKLPAIKEAEPEFKVIG